MLAPHIYVILEQLGEGWIVRMGKSRGFTKFYYSPCGKIIKGLAAVRRFLERQAAAAAGPPDGVHQDLDELPLQGELSLYLYPVGLVGDRGRRPVGTGRPVGSAVRQLA